MSNSAFRAVALAAAAQVCQGSGNTPEAIVTMAKKFLAFVEPADADEAKPSATPLAAVPEQKVSTPAKATAPAKGTTAKATVPAKAVPKATPVVIEKDVAAAAEDDGIDWAGDAGKQQVGDAIAKLIAANRRPEAIKLLSDYDSTSVSGVQVGEREAFVGEANELLAATPDITA